MLKENLYISTYIDYLKYLETESVEQLINQVLHLDKDEQQLLQEMRMQLGLKNCGQAMILNEYYIRCFDCGISNNHFYCQPCFDENQHLNHHVQLIRYDQGTGFCDCGDPNDIKAEGFCKTHSQIRIQNKLNDREILLLGKLKVLLEISCYNAIRFLEYIAKLPIIQADEDLIQSSDSLKYILQVQAQAYKANEKMNQIIIYLTGSNPRMSEIVCQVFTSQVPLGLQQIQQLNHDHQEMFDIGIQIKNNQGSICQCSVWKNLLRYIIFLNKKFDQILNIEKYLPHLFIDHYAITKTFIEMIPFQIQQFTKVQFYWEKKDKKYSLYVPLNYQEGLNEYLQSQEVQNQDCLQIKTNEVQISSEIFCICYQLEKKIIQYFQLHQQQIDYIAQFIEQGVLSSNRFSKVLYQLRVKLFRQLDKPQIIFCLNEILQNNPTDSYVYKIIIGLIPCQPYQKHQKYDIQLQEKDIYRLIFNQCHILKLFDKFFYDLIQNCQDNLQKLQLTRILLQGLVKKLIKRYPHNNKNQFQLQKLQFLFAQFVSADHIVIILLSFYFQLKQVQKGQQFLQIIIEDLQISCQELQQLLNNLAYRAIQNLVLINDTKYNIYYCRKNPIYNFNNNASEFSQESLDYSIIQIYFFLYGEDALQEAYSYVHLLNHNFKTNFIGDRLINQVLSSDFDMFQTCSHYFKDDLPQDFKAALRKVIKSLFYAQNYLSYKQIIDNLNQMGNNQLNMINSNYLLEILDLEPYSGQLQLKKQFQPPLYEPLFFNNQALHKQIQDKLNQNTNLELTIFGNSIEHDFLCVEENQQTLSFIRKDIIEQIFKGQNKIFTLLSTELKCIKNEKTKIKIIQSNKQFIYLVIMASKYLKIPDQNQKDLKDFIDVILQLNVQNDIINILKKNLTVNKQIVQIKQSNHNDQKLLLMKQKFQQKQQKFENNLGQDQIIQKDYDPNFICNFCAQQMDISLNDCQQIVLLQLNNNILFTSQFQDLQYLHYLQNFSNSQSEITFSGCSHIFHKKCINQLKVIELNEEQFYQCEICKSLGNIIFPFKYQNSKEIFQDIGYFSIISKTDMLEYYYKAYNINQELDIKSVNREIYLQIYLYFIRQIISNSNFYESLDNVQKFKQLTLILKQLMDDYSSNQYFTIINKYPQSVIFQMLETILVNRFNLETQQFSEEILKVLGNFKLLDLYNQDIFKKLFKYQPENHQFINKQSIIVQKAEQFTNLKDLQMRLLQKCIECKKLSQYICIGCNQKVCIGIKVILDYKKSCCYSHSVKCHNGNVNIFDVQTGEGFISYHSQIIIYQKSLFKTKLGQKFEGDFQNSFKYLADPIALKEFYQIQIHNKQLEYIIKNKK